MPTTVFKPIEIKDYSFESDLNKDLVFKDSLVIDDNFDVSDSIELDNELGDLRIEDIKSGYIEMQGESGILHFQNAGYLRNGGWRLSSNGEIRSDQKLITGTGGKRIEIDGINGKLFLYAPDAANAIEFRTDDNIFAARIDTFFNSLNNASGMDLIGGGSSIASLSGKSNLGNIVFGFDNGTNAGGMNIDWSANDLPGTVTSYFTSRLACNRTDITVGAGFSLTAAQLLTPYIQLTGTAARTSDATTAIADPISTGQILFLEGTSDVNTITILDNANTQLAGAANAVLGQFDTLTLLFNGTQWIEIARSNN